MRVALLLLAGGGVYAGTPIEWMPPWVANVWRFFLFVATCLIIGQFIMMMKHRYGRFRFQSRSMSFFWSAIFVFLLRTVVVQIERFGGQAVYEGLPMDTVAVVLLGVGIRYYKQGS